MNNEELLKRLSKVEERLGRTEDWILYLTNNQASKDNEGANKNAADSVALPSKNTASGIETKTRVEARKQSDSSWWLGAVGIFCFILASLFFVKLSIDSGWLTIERQLGILVLGGFTFVGLSFVFKGKDKSYAGYLAAAGLIILYLSSYSSHMYFNIASAETSAISVVLCALLSLWLRQFYESDFFLVTSAVGIFSLPVVMSLPLAQEWNLFYTTLWALVFSVLSVRLNSRLLAVLSSYLAIGVTVWLVLDYRNLYMWGALTLAFQFVLFVAGAALHSRHYKKALSASESWAYLPVLLLFYLAEYSLLQKLVGNNADYLALFFAGLLYWVYARAARSLGSAVLSSATMVNSFVALVVFHSFYLGIVPDSLKHLLMPLIPVSLLLFYFLSPQNSGKWNAAYVPFAVMVSLVMGSEYLSFISNDLNFSTRLSALVASVAILASGVLIFGKQKTLSRVLLGFAHSIALTSLYRLAADHGSLAVSGVWGLYAALILGWGFARKDVVLAKSSLVVLVAATFKALLYDVSGSSPVVRIVCLLLTGALLYSAGFVLRKINSFKED